MDVDNNLSIPDQKSIFKDKTIIGKKFEIVCWDTGSFFTPNYSIDVLKSNGILDYKLKVKSNEFYVKSNLDNISNVDFRPMADPVPVKPVWPIKLIFLSILLVVSIYFIFYFWKNREKGNFEKKSYLYLETPKERAINRMQILENETDQGKYYSHLSKILKQFLEEKFYIHVLEMTTKEIIDNQTLLPITQDYFSKVISILKTADKIKYANDLVDNSQLKYDRDLLSEIIGIN